MLTETADIEADSRRARPKVTCHRETRPTEPDAAARPVAGSDLVRTDVTDETHASSVSITKAALVMAAARIAI